MLGGALPAIGDATPLPNAKALLMDQGAHLTNFFIHTPICCPSRSETFTGRYLHNVKLPVSTSKPPHPQCTDGYVGNDDHGNVCCMHVDEALVNNYTFARYMHERAAYRVGGWALCACVVYFRSYESLLQTQPQVCSGST